MKNKERKDEPIHSLNQFGSVIVATGKANQKQYLTCVKCGCSSLDNPLYRTTPIGEENAGWTCLPCIEKHEPELVKNIKSDDKDVTKLVDIITGKTKNT